MKRFCLSSMAVLLAGTGGHAQQAIQLPTSKQLLPVPGSPQQTNSLPMTIASSPDGRYLALLNGGYGTYESRYQQSIALVDTSRGKVTDYPEPRTASGMPQTLYQGLAFGSDGTRLYASFDSLTAPEGGKPGQTGNAIDAGATDSHSAAATRPRPESERASGLPARREGDTRPGRHRCGEWRGR